jgi:hypothetical protein
MQIQWVCPDDYGTPKFLVRSLIINLKICATLLGKLQEFHRYLLWIKRDWIIDLCSIEETFSLINFGIHVSGTVMLICHPVRWSHEALLVYPR